MNKRKSILSTALKLCIILAVATAKDFYKILGVNRKSTPKEIKKAYRAMSLKYHPDKNKEEGAADRFSDIARAYEVISDEEKKEIYDQQGEEGLERHEQMGGQGGGGFGDMNDIFSQFGFNFGGGGGRGRGRAEERTPSIEMPIRLTMKQLYTGDTMDVEFVRQVLCLNWEECMKNNKECHGPGTRVRMQQIGPGFVQQVQSRDSRCVSRGKMWQKNCRACPDGQTTTEKIDLTLEIPPGARPGEHITFEEVADEKPGMKAGDLNFKITEIGSNDFTRDGDNLYKTIEIPLVDALVGFSKTLTHVDGKTFNIKVPGVVECDHVMRAAGKGMPRRSGRGFGDLYLTFEVDFPESLTKEQKDGIEKILRTGDSNSNEEL